MSHKIFIALGLAMLATTAAYFAVQHNKNQQPFFSEADFAEFEGIPEIILRAQEFQVWMNENNKTYSGHPELIYRFKTWLKNYDIVEEHNAKNLSWTLGMNLFADLTREEFAALHLGFRRDLVREEDKNEVILDEYTAPTSIDWRDKGAVGYIRNQGQCGGCWAFASCCALEALYKIKKGSLPNFSEQQLIDCSGSYGNQGCNGGTMVASFKYTKASGVELESNYPFKASAGTCKHSSSKVYYTNGGYQSVSQSYTQLKAAAAIQPVTVGVQADQSAFQMYKSGIVSSNCGTSLDHAITVVGYSGTSHWIVRNQWGTSWGEKGYVRIAMGSQNSGAGVCGINSMASYPTA